MYLTFAGDAGCHGTPNPTHKVHENSQAKVESGRKHLLEVGLPEVAYSCCSGVSTGDLPEGGPNDVSSSSLRCIGLATHLGQPGDVPRHCKHCHCKNSVQTRIPAHTLGAVKIENHVPTKILQEFQFAHRIERI